MSKRRRKTAWPDTETTGRSIWSGARPFAVSCRFGGETLYWEWTVDPFTRMPYVNRKDLREIRLIMGDRKVDKCFFNAQFDIPMLESIDVKVRGEIHELYLKVRCCYSFQKPMGLKPICKKFLGIKDVDQKDLQQATVKARRVAKKLGWNRALKGHIFGNKPVHMDYWMPETLWRLHPDLAKEKGIKRGACEKYAKLDADRTQQLDELFDYGMQDFGTDKIYEWERKELLPIVMEMTEGGVRIDEKRMRAAAAKCTEEIDRCMDLLVKSSGNEKFNPRAHAHVAKLLFEQLKLPVVSRTKVKVKKDKNGNEKRTGGNPKTGAEFITPHKHIPEVDAILSVKANIKARDEFFGKYEAVSEKKGKRVILHGGANQFGTGTSRFTYQNPNLQQVSDPTSTNSKGAAYVVDVRQIFVPRSKNHVWFCLDYSQVEVIIFADIAKEPTMLEAIRAGEDIHRATTNKIWGGEDNPRLDATLALINGQLHYDTLANWDGSPGEDDTPESLKHKGEVIEIALKHDGIITESAFADMMDLYAWQISDLELALFLKTFRKRAKSVTFTKIYGGGPVALMSWAGVDRQTANEILGDYDRAFPDMAAASSEIIKFAVKNGFIINKYGYRIQVDRSEAYKAVNYITQSSAAILMKRGMVKVYKYLKETGLDAKVVMTIHDELILEFLRREAFRSVLRECKNRMADHEGVFSVPTPVKIVRASERWSEKVPVNV